MGFFSNKQVERRNRNQRGRRILEQYKTRKMREQELMRILKAAMDIAEKYKEERDNALGAAIVPTPNNDITHKDWIHVYGGEEKSS